MTVPSTFWTRSVVTLNCLATSSRELFPEDELDAGSVELGE
jgi:hypothetical protein